MEEEEEESENQTPVKPAKDNSFLDLLRAKVQLAEAEESGDGELNEKSDRKSL